MASSSVGAPDKMTVYQKCVSQFGRSNVTAEEARALLTQLVHLFLIGETFAESEATQLFFTITRLFQKESAGLKQMIYLAIKEIAPLTDNVIMGTSVLMKDVQPGGPTSSGFGGFGGFSGSSSNEATAPGGRMDPKLYRSQALRALCRILDAGAVEGMDRIMRPAIVNSDPVYASAGIVSAYHLLGVSRDTVKRWSAEVQDAAQTQRGITQYHALGLLREVRAHDAMALRKLVVSLFEKRALSDPHAQVLHARMAGELLVRSVKQNGARNQPDGALVQILAAYMGQNYTAVALEAAKVALQAVPNANEVSEPYAALVGLALNVLAAQLQSPSAPSRFAAVRQLNRYALVNPNLVGSACNDAFEALVTDSNKSIATYAITALLKTGSEQNVDGLVQRISQMLGDIADDFRLVVVDAMRSLAKRYPSKHDQMLDFFAETLEHHGNAELKISIVDAIADILTAPGASSNADSLHNALMMLCETIEDSEYPQVTVRVLHLLGQAGPKASNPATYVRFIYNRVILENAVVRAAAVSALAKFSAVVPGAQSLVDKSKSDLNDEVRDRASIAFVAEVTDLPSAKLAISDLQRKLVDYLQEESFTSEFSASSVKTVTDEQRVQERVESVVEVPEAAATVPIGGAEGAGAAAGAAAGSAGGDAFEDTSLLSELNESVGKLSTQLGDRLKSGSVQVLTDDDMEYAVKARVHVYKQHLVLQYEVTNNYDLELERVSIANSDDGELEEQLQLIEELPVVSLPPSQTGTYLSVYSREGPTAGFFTSEMRYTADGDEDEYALGDVKIVPSVFVSPDPTLAVSQFDEKWDENEEIEETATKVLDEVTSVRDAASFVEERCGVVLLSEYPESDAQRATLLYGGTYEKEAPVLAKAQIVNSTRQGIVVKFTVRSADEQLAYAVMHGIEL